MSLNTICGVRRKTLPNSQNNEFSECLVTILGQNLFEYLSDSDNNKKYFIFLIL